MKFKMRYDRLSRWLTVIFTIAVVSGLAYIFYTSGGSYFPAWLTVLVVSVGLLVSLSFPRYVYVGAFSIEVRCSVELTRLEYKQIKTITPISRREIKWSIPLPGAGVWALMGYYGYYFDLKRWKLFRIYARSRRNLVRVELNSGAVVIFDAGDREEFMNIVTQAINQ